jgi:hypothetical protein
MLPISPPATAGRMLNRDWWVWPVGRRGTGRLADRGRGRLRTSNAEREMQMRRQADERSETEGHLGSSPI